MQSQFWKYPFKKSGYEEEEIEYITTDKVIGDYIVLPRKFFKLEGTTVYYRSGVIWIEATIGIAGEMLLAKDKDEDLSTELGINIYTRIQLNHANMVGGKIKIKYSPFGDILDPADFGQSVAPDADVVFNSLTLTDKLTSNSIETGNVEAEDITANKITLNEIFVNEVSIGASASKLTYEAPFLKIDGKTFPHILPANLQIGNTNKLLVLSPANYIELVPLNWLEIDVTNLDLKINGTSIVSKLSELEARIEALEE